MNRATAALAALATGTIVAATTIVPAMAAPRPAAAHPGRHVKTTAVRDIAAQSAKLASSQTVRIDSELDNGAYVTVVSCHGPDSPPPITLGRPGTPLTASGVGPSAGILATLKKPNSYKTIYTCTVVVKEKVPPKPKPAKARPRGCEIATGGHTGAKCTKPVTLNTGYGGLAPQVQLHRPTG